MNEKEIMEKCLKDSEELSDDYCGGESECTTRIALKLFDYRIRNKDKDSQEIKLNNNLGAIRYHQNNHEAINFSGLKQNIKNFIEVIKRNGVNHCDIKDVSKCLNIPEEITRRLVEQLEQEGELAK